MNKMRKMVQSKSSKHTFKLLGSRLFEGRDMTDVCEKFMKRKREIVVLQGMTDKIKKYMKENKMLLLKNKGEDEFKITEIKKSHKIG